MKAAELFAALRGVPAECLCGTIRYHTVGNAWYGDMGQLLDDHAAALQRDAMTDWLYSVGYQPWPEHWDHGTHKSWSINIDRRGESYPTRLHALASACRYVAGQKGAER